MATDGTEFDKDQPCAGHAPDENKSGQANHLLQHDRRMPEQGFHRCADGGEVPKEEHSLLLKTSKIPGRNGNLTLATGGERYGHFRSGGEGARADPIRRILAAIRSVIVGWPSPGREPDARCVAMHVFLLVRYSRRAMTAYGASLPLDAGATNDDVCPEADTHDHPHERRGRVGSGNSRGLDGGNPI